MYAIVMVAPRFIIRRVIPVVIFLICIILLTRHLPVDKRDRTLAVSDSSALDEVKYWEERVSNDINTSSERTNFVFIKCMKCATQTVANALRRFAFTRRLNVLLPRDNNIYLGWPYLMDKVDYRPSDKKFNCLMEHAIYSRNIMKPLFPSDTKYITIIREPWSHFQSTFYYFKVHVITDMNNALDPLVEYLKQIRKYEAIYKHHNSYPYRYCIPDGFSVTKNLLSHCLGMPLGFPENRTDISHNEASVYSYLKQLDGEFGLVMIMEYFDESMVFLKKLMRWSFKDIVYEKVNVGNYSTEPYPDYIKDIHKKWSSVDYLLYDHFRKKMELKIRNGGMEFQNELRQFKKILREVNRFCKSVKQSSRLTTKLTLREFTFSGHECAFMAEDVNHLDLLQKRSDAELKGKIPSYKRTC